MLKVIHILAHYCQVFFYSLYLLPLKPIERFGYDDRIWNRTFTIPISKAQTNSRCHGIKVFYLKIIDFISMLLTGNDTPHGGFSGMRSNFTLLDQLSPSFPGTACTTVRQSLIIIRYPRNSKWNLKRLHIQTQCNMECQHQPGWRPTCIVVMCMLS